MKTFTPEFRNRLDAIVNFGPLDERNILNVVDKFIIELEMQLDEKKVTIQVDKAARQWMADKGYDKMMGARPMERVIQDHLKKLLANELLFGELSKGGHVIVTTKDNDSELDVVIESATAKA